MLIFSYIILAAPVIAAASGGGSLPVGVFKRLLSPHGSGLQSRQGVTFDIPAQCTKTCEPIVATLENCTTYACDCTAQNVKALITCLECSVEVEPEEAETGQTLLDNFVNTCAAAGYPVTVPSGTTTPVTTKATPVTTNAPTHTPAKYFVNVANTTNSTTGSPGGKSGAVRVVSKAEVIWVLFSVWLAAVFVAAV